MHAPGKFLMTANQSEIRIAYPISVIEKIMQRLCLLLGISAYSFCSGSQKMPAAAEKRPEYFL